MASASAGAGQLWLPPLMELSAFGSDWTKYEAALFAQFSKDFIQSRPRFRGTQVQHKVYPASQNKPYLFWHLVSEGRIEEDRLPDLRRCERIAWPRPMIEEDGKPRVAVWENLRKGRSRVVIAVDDFSYVVVLEPRKTYTLVVTAYFVEHENRRSQLRKECDDWNR
jgi:hypothetical protein